MQKKLIIAEKKSVAEAIQQALGGFAFVDGFYVRDDLIVAYAQGHLLGIDASPVDKNDFPCLPAHYVLTPIDAQKEALLNKLCALINSDSVVALVNACDAGREGELIFNLIVDYAQSKKPVTRMWLQSMTEQAIVSAYDNQKSEQAMQGLKDAAYARQHADWLIGINGSRLMQQYSGVKTPVGRVLTPTVHLIVEREKAIVNFTSQSFWEIHAKVHLAAGDYVAKWHNKEPIEGCPVDRIYEREMLNTILDRLSGQAARNLRETAKTKRTNAPLLFDLTTLQREANKRYGFSAASTLKEAQFLYDNKLLTYPRTDSNYLPDDYVQTMHGSLVSILGYSPQFAQLIQPLLDANAINEEHGIFASEKVSDHFAIIPTGKLPSNQIFEQNPEAQTLYELVLLRTIACFYPPKTILETLRQFDIADELFEAKGEVIQDPGWSRVYFDASKETNTKQLPPMSDGELADVVSVDCVPGQTTPPKRYTEDTLLGAMEKAGRDIDDDVLRSMLKDKGIGTPATRAGMIEKALEYQYIEKSKNFLYPADTAIKLSDSLSKLDAQLYLSALTTAELENDLYQIETKLQAYDTYISKIHVAIASMIVQALRCEAWITRTKAQPLATCPKCGGGVFAFAKAFKCDNEQDKCGFFVYKNIGGATLTDADLRALLTLGHTREISGFISKNTGKPYSAILQLNTRNYSIEFSFPEATTYPCPKCGKRLFQRTKKGKTGYNFWGCEGYKDQSCNASFENNKKNNRPIF